MNETTDLSYYKELCKKHWKILTIFIIAGIGCVIGLFLVLLFQINTSWVGGNGTWNLGEFSIGTTLLFCIQLMLWEFLLVFLPGIAFFCITGYLWWKKLPEEEKNEIKEREKKERELKTKQYGGGGAIGFFIWIAFFIIVFVQGNWLTPFNALSYTYFVTAGLQALLWIVLLIILPAVILGLIWFIRKN